MCKLPADTTITRISFIKGDTMKVSLSDGRTVTVPLSLFPEIQNLTPEQRKRWTILDGQFFTFPDDTAIFSIEDLLQTEIPKPRNAC